MEKIDLEFSKSLKKYGAVDISPCFNCGNCTAICSLSTEDNSFPRKMLRYSILGLQDRISSSVDPWLCYYCGECSETCPKEANPGELMMALRRFLVGQYDWTGLARKFYTSKIWEMGAILFLALIILVIFVVFHGPLTTELTAEGGVKLNTFAPWHQIHIGDWIMAGFLAFFLLSNVFNMYLKILRNDKKIKIPFRLYFTEFISLVRNFITQERIKDCEKGKVYWLIHLLLMSGYVILFTMIVGFLGWFQTDNIYEWWHPQRLLGYYATFGLLVGCVYFFIGRIKKDKELNKHSHYTDWTFLVLLFFTTLTGILLHFFRIYGMPMATYYMYVIHLMILFPMLMIEVPFSKWSHLAYRPVAIYFSNVLNKAKELQKS